MGRKGSSAHKWTDEERAELGRIVETCEQTWEVYQRQGRSRDAWWDSVAGAAMMQMGIAVTGPACQRQWEKYIRPAPVERNPNGLYYGDLCDTSTESSDMADHRETTLRIMSDVIEMRDSIEIIQGQLAELLAEWKGK